MNFLLLLRAIRSGCRHIRRQFSFFLFLTLSFCLLSTVTMFFDALKANRGRYFAQRYTGFYGIVKKDCFNLLTASPPREEDLFNPDELCTLLDRLGISYSARLRSWATFYVDEPDRQELRNPNHVLLVASDAAAETALLKHLVFNGAVPHEGANEALLYDSSVSQEALRQGIIVQMPSPFGIPVSDKFRLTGTFTSDEAMMHQPILFIDRRLVLELTGREENLASDIVLGQLSALQRFRLTWLLATEYRDYKLLPYTDFDSIAKATALISETLRTLLFLFTGIVILFCMLNSLTIAVLNRSKEIGVLRVIGYSANLIIGLFCIEYLTMLAAAWLIGSAGCAGIAALLNTLQLSATDINLELAFAGKELVIHPSLRVFVLPLCVSALMLLGITGLRTRQTLALS